MDATSIIARHDYLPFGEEIGAGTGMRTSGQGFGVTDPVRQRYGLTERDDTTGLDHTWWRKYENRSGRWTSPDPYRGSMMISNPQSFNLYSYVQNDPVNFVDPSGLDDQPPDLPPDPWDPSDIITTDVWESADRGGGGGGGRPRVRQRILDTGIEDGSVPEVPLTPDQTGAVGDQISRLLTDKCAKFINQLVTSVTGKSYDSRKSLLADFNKIRDGKGGFFSGGTVYGGGASGSLAGGNAKININLSTGLAGVGIGVLHEMIHIIAAADDKALSESVRKLGIQVIGYPGYIVPYPTDKTNSNLAFSKYWGQALKNACTPRGY